MSFEGSDRKSGTVVVVAKEMIIARDLENMIAEATPGARIVLASSLAEASRRVPLATEVDIALVDTDPDTFSRSDLAARMSRHRAYIIFLGRSWGNWTVPPGSRWAVLDYPFSREDLLQLMRSV